MATDSPELVRSRELLAKRERDAERLKQDGAPEGIVGQAESRVAHARRVVARLEATSEPSKPNRSRAKTKKEAPAPKPVAKEGADDNAD